MPQERSAGFVVFRKQAGKGFYLLLECRDGRWDFPKGNIERGETPKDAALRELKEEAGITDIELIEGFEHRIAYFYRLKGRLIHKEVVFFLCKTGQEKAKVSWEHKSAVWFAYEEAMAKLKFANARQTLGKAKTFLEANRGWQRF